MNRYVLIGATMGPLSQRAADLCAVRGYTATVLPDINDEDIACGLANVDNDACVAAVAIIGQYLRVLGDFNGKDVSVLAPELCKDCRSICLPQLMRTAFDRAGFGNVRVLEIPSADVAACCSMPEVPLLEERTRTVGICGSVPVLLTELFHATVVDYLHAAGLQTLMPPVAQLVHDADFLTPALQFFQEVGVRTVICIVPFGCMGGHVYARGQLRKLQRLYPDIEITVLDYDPSASDINVVNRIELIVQSTYDEACEAGI